MAAVAVAKLNLHWNWYHLNLRPVLTEYLNLAAAGALGLIVAEDLSQDPGLNLLFCVGLDITSGVKYASTIWFSLCSVRLLVPPC